MSRQMSILLLFIFPETVLIHVLQSIQKYVKWSMVRKPQGFD